MNLVIQGARVDALTLKTLAALSAASSIVQLAPHAFRLVDAVAHDDIEPLCTREHLDHTWVPGGRRLDDFRLFVTDMDSTLINIECIDEIADLCGVKGEVAAITEAAMRGEIDFAESLTRRVALLRGLPVDALAQVYEERLQLNPGAERLLRELKAAGFYTVLVSGGFTYFTDRLKTRLGFDEAWANELEIDNGTLSGRISGPVVDAAAKAAHLAGACARHGVDLTQAIAAGDGANDLPMLGAAGFSVAYRAKPVVREVADCRLDHSGLDGILNVLR